MLMYLWWGWVWESVVGLMIYQKEVCTFVRASKHTHIHTQAHSHAHTHTHASTHTRAHITATETNKEQNKYTCIWHNMHTQTHINTHTHTRAHITATETNKQQNNCTCIWHNMPTHTHTQPNNTGCSEKIVFFQNSLLPLPRLHRCKRPSKLSTKCECTVTPIGW